MAQKPLMLKDYLEVDSCLDSPRWTPLRRSSGNTISRLLETELGSGDVRRGWRLVRSRAKSTFARLSTVFRLPHFAAEDAPSTVTCAGPGHLLSRSFSRKLRRNFWKKSSCEKEEDATLKVIVRLRSSGLEAAERVSLFYPSPVVSRCSSSSDFISPTARRSAVSPEKLNFVLAADESRQPFTGIPKPEEICGKEMGSPLEEKEQHSPVSVMDFPFQEDGDEDETEAAEQNNIIDFEIAKNQLLQKIRRFEILASLDPVHLDFCFSGIQTHAGITVHVENDDEDGGEDGGEASKERQRLAAALLRTLTRKNSLPADTEKLLYDFFLEGLLFAEDSRRGTKNGSSGSDELISLASRWVAGYETAAEYNDAVALMEMEACCQGWKRFEEEEELVAVELTGGMVTRLTEELVADLLISLA